MNTLEGKVTVDEIEVACALTEPPSGSRPHLLIILSLLERSPNRQRELYLPLQSHFFFLRNGSLPTVIGPGIDLTAYPPTGLADATIPRNQPMTLSSGVGLDASTISAISTTVRQMSAVTFEVRFVAPLLNNVRTLNQRMFAFALPFRFTLDLSTWNVRLSRWRETYLSSDLSNTVPSEIAADFSEGARCLSVEAFRACVVMLRRSLESAANEKGGAGRNLLSKLQSLVEKRILSDADHALAQGVRIFGNYGAHPSTDQLSSVTREDAELVLQVARRLLKKMFGTDP